MLREQHLGPVRHNFLAILFHNRTQIPNLMFCHFWFTGNDIGPEGAKSIARALETNQTVHTIALTGARQNLLHAASI